MSLTFLPSDLIINILSYTWSGYDLKIIRMLNKAFRDIINDYGTLRELNACINSNLHNFIRAHVKNRKSLRSLYMCRINNPIIWIPCVWPERVAFMRCNMRNTVIEPPRTSNTEELRIECSYICRMNNDNIKYRLKNPLYINIKKLPKLKTLVIKTLSFDFNCLKNCKSLETLSFNLIPYYDRIWKSSMGGEIGTIPEFIGKLPNIRQIITNCKVPNKYKKLIR